MRSTDLELRLISLLGVGVMLGLGWLFSLDRRHPPWRVLGIGLAFEFALALLLLKTPLGRLLFAAAERGVAVLTASTQAGAFFVFGPLAEVGFSLALHVLPVIVFLASLFGILYHLGLLQRVVRGLAFGLGRGMKLSGAESLAAAANVFLGMVEAPLCVRPYIAGMTRSELFTVMTTGMATVAGSVLVVYAAFLGPGYAGHLVTASMLAAPAGVMLAKLVLPEREVPATMQVEAVELPRDTRNAIDAAARGALTGLRLAASIGAMLIAFVALVHFVNAGIGAAGHWIGLPELSLQRLLGYGFAPLAWFLGIPSADATTVGALLGIKTVLNEFLAYRELAALIEAGALSPRAAVLSAYAMCGFANLGSLAILLGGLGEMAPGRRGDLAALGPRAIVAGTLATLLAGCVAGVVL